MENVDIDEVETQHNLEDTWTLWFQKKNTTGTVQARAWLDSLKEVMTFGTVEEFWRMYNNIKSPAEMPSGTDYCVFKEGIEPKWEAPEHGEGGTWTATVPFNIQEADNLNKMWMYSLLACIGADFGHEDYESITGLYLSIRPSQAKIQLWCRSPDEEQQRRVSSRFLEILEEITKTSKLQFKPFDQCRVPSSTTPKKRNYRENRGEGRDNFNRSGEISRNPEFRDGRDSLNSSTGSFQ